MLNPPLLTLDVRLEADVVRARRRARQLAELLGFSPSEQTRIATAVFEVAHHIFQHGGRVEFLVEGPAFVARFTGHGPGVRDLREVPAGARRLMDRFEVECPPEGGTRVVLGKDLPPGTTLTPERIGELARGVAGLALPDPVEDVERQNRELLLTLEELHARQAELVQLNRELDETNRGVVALYAELDERAEELRRASEVKTRFLSNMTHELRSPLNSILSLSRLLLDRVDGELNPEQEKQVTFIRRAAEGLSELVNDLLDLAKLEAGKLPVRVGEFEVADLFATLRGMLRPLLAPHSAVNLVFDAEGFPPLRTDEGKVSQILRNLISNALKYTQRGEVRVSARRRQDGRVEFTVADTGIGIPPEYHEAIFQEFFQVDGPHQHGVKGTGLGLPLTRKLAGLLGGTVAVRSEPGAGSTFTVALPPEYGGPIDSAPPVDMKVTVEPGRQAVLFIEDNRETLLLYEQYLKGTPFQMVPALTVKDARKALSRFRPAAVVSDILLAEENTWDFLAELKASPQTGAIPLVVATVVNNEPKARALGADAFARKPIDRGWLVQQLQNLVVPTSGEKLLVVDDEEVARYVLRGLFADSGFTVVEAAGGPEGIERALAERPRAIFLDLSMPGMDGEEVLDRLKAAPGTRDIPVILHTSRPAEETGPLLAKGAVGVLPKQNVSRASAREAARALLEGAGVKWPEGGRGADRG